MTASKPPASKYWSPAVARAALAALDASGLPIAAFAREHDLSPQRLLYWHHRLSAEQPAFIAVQTVPTTPSRIEITVSAVWIHIHEDIDPVFLARIVAALTREPPAC